MPAEDINNFPPNIRRLLSVEFLKEHRLCAWSVHAVIFSKTITIKKRGRPRKHSLMQPTGYVEGRIIIYHGRFIRLLSYPKPLRDQLMLEFPTLNAFRTDEVATARVEHIDFEHGDIEVLDSKKHCLITVPLDFKLARHLEQYLSDLGLQAGLLFKPGSRAGRKTLNSLSNQAIEYTWKKWCLACGIPYMPPRYGRAYFAVNWHILRGKSLLGLMEVLRHTSLLSTQRYLSKIRSYEDLKAEFHRGLESPFSLSSRCSRFELCPVSSDGCRCRCYQATLGVDLKK